MGCKTSSDMPFGQAGFRLQRCIGFRCGLIPEDASGCVFLVERDSAQSASWPIIDYDEGYCTPLRRSNRAFSSYALLTGD